MSGTEEDDCHVDETDSTIGDVRGKVFTINSRRLSNHHQLVAEILGLPTQAPADELIESRLARTHGMCR